MILDFHTHCFPPKLFKYAMDKLCDNMHHRLVPTFDGSLEGLRSSMRAANVTDAVICNIATNAKQNTSVNDFAIATNDIKNGIYAFGSIHPEFLDYKAELRRLKENGIKGIKLHADYQNFFANDKNMYKIYQECAELGFIMLFHTGEDMGIADKGRTTPKLLRQVLNDFSGTPIVAAHTGGFGYWEQTEQYLLGTDIYFDTSFGLNLMETERAQRFLKYHPKDKILFATDAPWGNQKKDIQTISDLILDDEHRQMVLYKNGKALLDSI